MNVNAESSSPKVKTKKLRLCKHSSRISLVNLKKEEKSNYFPYVDKKQVDPSDSSYAVGKWLDDSDPHKRVQFSGHITVVSKSVKSTKSNQTRQANHPTLPLIDQHNNPSNRLPTITTERLNDHTTNLSSIQHSSPAVAITESTLYRSANDRSLSLSSIDSSSIAPSRRSSFTHNDQEHAPSRRSSFTQNEQEHAPSIISSIEPASSISINKDRLPSLEVDSSLSEFDQKKLHDIRQLIPDEFEKLVPTLIKLGVVKWPTNLFENNTGQLTRKELIERHRLKTLIIPDQENIEHKRHLESLYGSFRSKDDIHHKASSLRETLSFQGQLSLLAAYRDEIERELNKKIKYWRSIPMQSKQTTLSENSYSTNKSSILSRRANIKTKSIKANQSVKSSSNLSEMLNDQSFQISLPDQIDNQWYTKSIVYIIEQGMNLLDRTRSLPQSILPNIYSNEQYIHDTIYDIKRQDLVRTFKRWLFLWSILYSEDKCQI